MVSRSYNDIMTRRKETYNRTIPGRLCLLPSPPFFLASVMSMGEAVHARTEDRRAIRFFVVEDKEGLV